MRYEASPDGTQSNGQVFFDMTSAPGEYAIDGITVGQQGNLYVSGPGGLRLGCSALLGIKRYKKACLRLTGYRADNFFTHAEFYRVLGAACFKHGPAVFVCIFA